MCEVFASALERRTGESHDRSVNPVLWRRSTEGRQSDAALTGERPQQYHHEQLSSGIQELSPELVVLRKMGDIQALTRSREVRQFGLGPMAAAMSSGGEGAQLGLGGHHVAIPLELDGAEHTKWRKILDPVFAPEKTGCA